jgi:hypothetical protein
MLWPFNVTLFNKWVLIEYWVPAPQWGLDMTQATLTVWCIKIRCVQKAMQKVIALGNTWMSWPHFRTMLSARLQERRSEVTKVTIQSMSRTWQDIACYCIYTFYKSAKNLASLS